MELQTKNQTSASRYTAYTPDKNGYINYSNAEDKVWNILYDRQIGIVQNYAAKAYLSGLDKLELSNTKIPQPVTVSTRLREITGWEVAPVAALIDFNYFFELLANKRFPAASFIRCMEDLDYLKEPDIFHEIFGHCPMLTEPSFAAFVQEVGKFGATLDKSFQVMLGRLFWFTVEFGLIQENHGLRVYGAGILSSKSESIYSIDSEIPRRVEFNLIEALRTPYRYDKMQKTYFVIDSYENLYNMVNGKLLTAFKTAQELGMLPNLFEIDKELGTPVSADNTESVCC